MACKLVGRIALPVVVMMLMIHDADDHGGGLS
jgi:hypothetical protein